MAVDIPNKRKLVQFNLTKLCSVPNPVHHQHSPNQTASTESNTPGQRLHIPNSMFMMKLTSCTWMKQLMWKLQSLNTLNVCRTVVDLGEGPLILGRERRIHRRKKSEERKQNETAHPIAQGLDPPPQEMHLH